MEDQNVDGKITIKFYLTEVTCQEWKVVKLPQDIIIQRTLQNLRVLPPNCSSI
jgi:hypothetical protein